MEAQPKLWPSDEAFSDKAIWDAAIQLAYQRNELEDSIRMLSQLYESYLNQAYAKPERIAGREQALSEMRGNACMLDIAIAALIGRESGLVQISPYYDSCDSIEQEDERRTSSGEYFVDGEVRFIES